MSEKDQIELLFQFDKLVPILVIEVDATMWQLSITEVYIYIYVSI